MAWPKFVMCKNHILQFHSDSKPTRWVSMLKKIYLFIQLGSRAFLGRKTGVGSARGPSRGDD